MNLQLPEVISEKKDWTWTTKEGEVLRIDQMGTGHIFNAMKMLFNHLAITWGGKPVWFVHQYRDYMCYSKSQPEWMFLTMCYFIQEIEKRGDLPDRYREPYKDIIGQLMRKIEIQNPIPKEVLKIAKIEGCRCGPWDCCRECCCCWS